jgi:hypothetical protein
VRLKSPGGVAAAISGEREGAITDLPSRLLWPRTGRVAHRRFATLVVNVRLTALNGAGIAAASLAPDVLDD